jgi:hypothetical protein
MFTIFDFFGLMLPIAGLVYGATLGLERGGVLAATVGGVLGAAAGFLVARLALLLPVALISMALRRRSTSDLRSELRSDACLAPNVLLIELRRRGEVGEEDLAVIYDLLLHDSLERRTRGLAALRSAFPELAAAIPEYRADVVDAAARAAVLRLRQRGAGASPAPDAADEVRPI